MAARPDIETAASISSVGCDACPCGSIHVRLHDRGGEIFAAASMPLATAERFIKQLQQHVAAAKKQGLSANRLRKPGAEILKDGSTAKNPQRMGPLTFAARLWALGEILAIQAEVNAAAEALGRPPLDLLNAEEEARIRELIAAGTWPQGWDGDEPTADTPLDAVYADGSVQPLLIGAGL